MFVFFGFATAQTPIEKSRKASFEIGQTTISDDVQCSATAIGPHALLTATHCELPSEELLLRGINEPLPIVGRIRDGNDHTIYLLKNITFINFSEVRLNDSFAPSQNVFMWGNPGSWQDIFRKGYIAGTLKDRSLAAAFGVGEPDAILFDFQSYNGDSGAAIYNEAGQVIAVNSEIVWQSRNFGPNFTAKISMAAAFAFNFKQTDIDRARNFGANQTSQKEPTKNFCDDFGFWESIQHFCVPNRWNFLK